MTAHNSASPSVASLDVKPCDLPNHLSFSPSRYILLDVDVQPLCAKNLVRLTMMFGIDVSTFTVFVRDPDPPIVSVIVLQRDLKATFALIKIGVGHGDVAEGPA